jgi:hypothetical protein
MFFGESFLSLCKHIVATTQNSSITFLQRSPEDAKKSEKKTDKKV